MKKRLLVALALSTPLVAHGQEQTLIAGWDFSQYAIAGYLTFDSATITGNVLDANHSDLDPTYQVGIESNDFGTMYLNGSFGSTPTPLSLEGLDPFQPVDAPGSLLSNVDQAFQGFGSQAACTVSKLESMPHANCANLAMTAISAVNVVFEADRGGEATGSWVVSFAGRTITEGTSTVGVEFSTDGSSYTPVGSALITESDSDFEFPLGAPSSRTAYVRLVFSTSPSIYANPVIDNLGIALPEPAQGAAVAVLALGFLRRSRRRA